MFECKPDNGGSSLKEQYYNSSKSSFVAGNEHKCDVFASRCESWGCIIHGPQRALGLLKQFQAGVPEHAAYGVTLSLQDSACWQDCRINARKLFRTIRNVVGGIEYIYTIEAHKNGSLHIHACVLSGVAVDSAELDQRIRSSGLVHSSFQNYSGVGNPLLVTFLPDQVQVAKGQTVRQAVGLWNRYILKNYIGSRQIDRTSYASAFRGHLELNGDRPFHGSLGVMSTALRKGPQHGRGETVEGKLRNSYRAIMGFNPEAIQNDFSNKCV